jgi:hypothetical protein
MRKLLLLVLLIVGVSSCNTLAEDSGAGVVIARSAQVRSSTAVVAADLVEVVRGDSVEILDSTEGDEGERWYRVRVNNAEGTRGGLRHVTLCRRNYCSGLRRLRKLTRISLRKQSDSCVQARICGSHLSARTMRISCLDWKADQGLKSSDGSAYLHRRRRARRRMTMQLRRVRRQTRIGTGAGTTSAARATEVWYKVRHAAFGRRLRLRVVYASRSSLVRGERYNLIPDRAGEFVAWQRLDGDVRGIAEQHDDNEDTRPAVG